MTELLDVVQQPVDHVRTLSQRLKLEKRLLRGISNVKIVEDAPALNSVRI